MGVGERGAGSGMGRRPQGPSDEETLRRTDRNEIPRSISSEGVLLLTHTVEEDGGGHVRYSSPDCSQSHTHTPSHSYTLDDISSDSEGQQSSPVGGEPHTSHPTCTHYHTPQSLGGPSDFGLILMLFCNDFASQEEKKRLAMSLS